MRALIVGAGSMGSWFARLLLDRGWGVDLFDVSYERALKASKNGGRAVKEPSFKYELALIAVPIRETPKAVMEHHERADVVVEISSVKSRVVSLVREKGFENVLSIHPLFGPGLENPEEGKAVLIPIKDPEKELRVAKSLFPFKFLVRDVASHDRAMAWLAVSHAVLNAFLASTEGISESLDEMSTTTVRALLTLAGASLTQSPSLTEELIKENPFYQEEFSRFLKELSHFSEDPASVINKVRRWKSLLNVERCYKALYQMLREL